MKQIVLPQSFFDRPTLRVAKELIGKYIVHREHNREIVLMITEVEAYDGPHDLASHASRRKYAGDHKTGRAAIMFGAAGYLYTFFTYGMHWMANVVVGPKEYPAAILLRGGMYEDAKTGKHVSVSGPARLTKFLKIDGGANGKMANRKNGIWFEDRGVRIPSANISASKRIGVDYAGPIWAEKEYNFKVKN